MSLRRSALILSAALVGAAALPAQAVSYKVPAPFALKGKAVQALVRSGKVVLAGTPTGASRSPDGGKTWKSAGLAGDVTALAVDAANAKVVYAGVGTAVWRSTASGTGWTQLPALATLPAGSTATLPAVTSVAARGATVLVGTDADAFISRDSGATWTHAGLESQVGYDSVQSVAIQGFNGWLWAAGRYGGVWVNTGRSAQWGQLDDGLPVLASSGGVATQWNAQSVFFPADSTHPTFVSSCGEAFSLENAQIGTYQWEDRGSLAHSQVVSCSGFQPQPITSKVWAAGNRQHVGTCSERSGCYAPWQLTHGKLLSVALGDPKKKGGAKRLLIGTTVGLEAIDLPKDLS